MMISNIVDLMDVTRSVQHYDKKVLIGESLFLVSSLTSVDDVGISIIRWRAQQLKASISKWLIWSKLLHKNYKLFNTKIRMNSLISSSLTPDPPLTNPDTIVWV